MVASRNQTGGLQENAEVDPRHACVYVQGHSDAMNNDSTTEEEEPALLAKRSVVGREEGVNEH